MIKRRILNPATTGTITLEEARALIREFERERSSGKPLVVNRRRPAGKASRVTRTSANKKK